KLQVTPVASSIPVGLSEQLIAQATLSDGRVLDVTSDAALSWSSSNTQVATIVGNGTKQGLLTGVAPGTVTITASGVANGQTFKSSVQVIVTDAVVSRLQIEPVVSSLPAGLSQQFHAKAIFSDGRVFDVTKDDALSWTVDEPSIATILTSDANKGRLTGITPGNVTISAFLVTNGQTFTSTAQVTITEAVIIQLQVTPVTKSVPVGLTTQFTAIATLSDGRTQDLTNDPALSWSSNSPSIATINSSQPNNNGLATGMSTGSTTITATAYVDGTFFNATAQLDVTQAVVTALQITPAIDSVPVGLTKPFTAIATLSDGRTQDLTNDPALSWSSDSPSIATINSSQPNNNGLATGVSTGSTTITATAYVDGTFFNATAQLNVTQAVVTALQITPAIDSVPVGLTKPFTAI
ncbi:MAG: Ig-like domain-containing protein, partial [Plesiomonas sp.]